MTTSIDKYHTKIHETLIDYNKRNDASLCNETTRDEIHKIIEEKESDAHNIILDAHNAIADTFGQTSNAQREN